MTILFLALCWISLATLVHPRSGRLLARLRPGARAIVLIGSIVGLITIPASAVVITLATGLQTIGTEGSPLSRCGRLIVAVLARPLSRPDLSLSFLALTLGAAAVAFGFTSAWRSQRNCRAAMSGLGQACVIMESNEPFAFTAGLMRPRIVLSTALLLRTPGEWIKVVFAHEEAHRKGRHPLLILVAEALARAFPIPALRWAADSFRLALEELADESAAARLGSRELVAEALAGLALASTGTSPGFEGNEVTRVRRLLSPPPRGRRVQAALVVAMVALSIGFSFGHAIHCGEASVQILRIEQCPLAKSS